MEGEEGAAPAERPASSTNPLRVLRNRNFSRLFFAGAASTAGFAIGQVAVTWLVYTVTKSAVNVALIGISYFLAVIVLSLFAGTLVDRQERRRLMIVSDVIRCTALAIATFALYFWGFNLLLLLGVVFVLGAFTTVFQPAERALIPMLIEKDEIVDANGLTQITTSLAQFAANAAGGLLIAAVGALGAMGLNSLTFLVSASLLALIVVSRTRGPDQSSDKPKPGYMEDAREGLRYIASQKSLLSITLMFSAGNVFLSIVGAFFVVYTTSILHGNATVYGVIAALFSLGIGPGSILVSRVGSIRWAGKGSIVGGAVQGAATAVLVLTSNQYVAYAGVFLIGFILGFVNTTWLSTVQLTVPSEMQGRYFGIDQLGSFATIPLGQILGGYLISARGVQFTYGLAAAGLLVTSLVFALSRSTREWRYSGRGEEFRIEPQEPGS